MDRALLNSVIDAIDAITDAKAFVWAACFIAEGAGRSQEAEAQVACCMRACERLVHAANGLQALQAQAKAALGMPE